MALYNEGKTGRQIAEAVFVSTGVVGTWRRKQGLPASRETRKKHSVAKPSELPVSPPMAPGPPVFAPPPVLSKAAGPVALSVELNGCSFALRAPDLEGAARAYEYAGRLLRDMVEAAEPAKAE